MPVRRCDLAVVEEMTARGASLQEIADACRVSRRTVSDAKKKLEVARDLRQHPLDAAVQELSKKNLTIREISNRLGVSTRSVNRARGRLNLSQTRELGPLEERFERARLIYEDGGSLHHAQSVTHLDQVTLRRLFPDWEPWSKSECGTAGAMARRLSLLPTRLS